MPSWDSKARALASSYLPWVFHPVSVTMKHNDPTIWTKSPHNHEVHFLLLSCDFLPSISTFFIVGRTLGYSLVRHPLVPQSALGAGSLSVQYPETSILLAQ